MSLQMSQTCDKLKAPSIWK